MSDPIRAALERLLQHIDDPIRTPFTREDAIAAARAALRAAVDQVVPHEPQECKEFTNEAVRLNRMGTRSQLLAIAAELEGVNG